MSVNSFKGLNRGIYCPIYGHAAINEDKRNIYQHMYEKSGDIWVKNGCLTHAITMFAHDRKRLIHGSGMDSDIDVLMPYAH